MNVQHPKYLAVETTSSTVVNALLNLLGAWVEFHGRLSIPTSGPKGLVADMVGQTFIVAFLSVLVPSMLTRRRIRSGLHEPASIAWQPGHLSNLYLRSLVFALCFTLLGSAFNALLLPRLFPGMVSHRDVLLYKTLYGAVIGMLATWFALRAALKEAE